MLSLDPFLVMLLEPVADRLLDADIAAGLFGLDPFVFEDLPLLIEEELPELALLHGARDPRRVGDPDAREPQLEIGHLGDRRQEEPVGLGRELDLPGDARLVTVDEERAELAQVLVRQEGDVLAARQAQGVRAPVDLLEKLGGQGDRDRRLALAAFLCHTSPQPTARPGPMSTRIERFHNA